MAGAATAPNRGKKKIAAAVGFLLILAGAVALYWYVYMRGIVYSDDARLDGGLLDLAPRISGTLAEVYVGAGDRISKGQVLFTLEKESLETALTSAEAMVDSAQAALIAAQTQYAKARNGPRPEEIEIAEAVRQKTEAQAKLARAEWDRAKTLYEGKVSSISARDRARTEWEIADQAHKQAISQLKLLRDGTRPEDVAAAKANVELRQAQLASAQIAVRQARINLDYAEVQAPFEGLVVRRWQSPGAIISAGRPVLTVFNPSDLEVSANIEEKYLNRIAVGNMVDISVDAYPGLTMTGQVDKILRATNSKFSLIPSEGSSGTFIKVAQRVPLKIALTAPPDLPLGPGMSVEIRIHVSDNGRFPAMAAGHE